jgi:hypothetical protein
MYHSIISINRWNKYYKDLFLEILLRNDHLTRFPVQIFKKRMLNIIIISLQSVNEWPVFNLKKNILTNILRLLLVRIHCSILRLHASSFHILWYHCADTGSWIRVQKRIFTLRANNKHWLPAIIEHAKTNILQQNMW